MAFSPLIVGIGGTLRSGSSTESALCVALAEAKRLGAHTQIFSGERLLVPLYGAASTGDAKVAELVDALRAASGIVLSSPGYHGSVSGVIKNALDHCEALSGDERPYLDGCPVACIAGAAGMQAAVQTLSTLRSIVHALRGWPAPLGVAFNSVQVRFDRTDDDIVCSDSIVQSQLTAVARQVVEFCTKS